MAYGLKYYKELTQPNGKVVRLEILEKGYEGASKEIGPVCQALRLDIQGDTEIDAPIVKTSLSMTFVDAPDHVDARTKKCGNWDEFYTSDATLWRVVLKARNAQETAFTTMWGGYITPDSYTEVLQYRGSVTLVARDNIGHLSDFPFDAEGNADGMISLIGLIREAWDKIESPMTLDDQAVANADWMLSDGVYAYDTYMNVSAFEDMNWYDALESALYAYGLVLRYTGNNNVSFYSLRNLPRMGAHEVEDISFIEPTFMSGAERELSPAVKIIEESVGYQIEERKAVALAESVSFTGATSTIPFNSKTLLDGTQVVNIPVWPIVNKTDEGWGNGDKTLFLNPQAYSTTALAGTLGDSLVLATNTDGSGRVWYGKYMQGKSFTMSVSFGQLMELSNKTSLASILLIPVTVKKVVASISATANGITKYLNEGGAWQTSEVFLDIAVDEATRTLSKVVPVGSFSTAETLVKFTIKDVTLGSRENGEWWDVSDGGGIYAELNALTFADNSGIALCETNNVNTKYDENNNIILSRDPQIAPALNDVLFPSFIRNGIFVKEGNTYKPAKTWAWGGQTPQQMAVYNHLQLLCYHAKPNNILRGTIVNADNTDMQTLWIWGGAEHMLVSGSLNFLNGYIENAVLREFARYEDMWGMLEPADFPEVEGKSRTTAENGTTTAGEGARTTNTTTVNIGGGGGSMTIDTFMSDTSTNAVGNRYIKAYVDDLGNDITEAYEAAIRALNTQIQGFLDDKVDDAVFDSLAAQVEVNKNSITALDTRLKAEEDVTTTYKDWWSALKEKIVVENGNVKISTNLIVTGDTSSGGSGSDTPASGTVTGIKVNGQTYEPTSAGIVTIPDYPTSLEWSAIDGKPTALSQFYNDLGLGSLAYLSGITSSMVTGALGYTPLSTSGGTIDGTNFSPLHIKSSSSSYAGLGLRLSGSSYSAYLLYKGDTTWAVTGENWVGEKTLIHSGNYATQIGDYYLKSSGGTITSNVNTILTLKGGASNLYSVAYFMNGDTYRGYVGWSSAYGFGLYHYTQNAHLGIKDDGTPHYNGNTLIHAGNYSSYALPLSGGTIGSGQSNSFPLLISSTNAYTGLAFYTSGGTGYLRFRGGSTWGVTDAGWNNSYTLIHSGNIGSHAVLLNGGGTITKGDLIMSSTASDVVTNKLYPRADGSYELGQTSRRWSTIYGVNGNFSGNVGIGTVTDSGYKLDVNGSGRFGHILLNKGYGNNVGDDTIEMDSAGATLWMQYYHNGGINMCYGGGQVTMGGKLSVAGAVTMASTLSVGNNVTLGAGLFMGNNVGFFFKNTSNANVLAMHVDTSNVLQIAYNNVNSVAIQRDTHINGNLVVSGDIASA